MNLLADENKIVSKSPFSAYRNEKDIYDGRKTSISLEHIMIKVKRGEVNGIDYEILKCVSELEFSTSRMITQLINLKGYNVEQEKVQRRLNFLNKTNIISRYMTVSEESKSNTRIYCLEKVGNVLLRSREWPSKWKQTDSIRPLETKKRILARNQIYLEYLRSGMDFESAKFDYKINSFKSDMIVETGTKKYVFLISRSYPTEIEKFEVKVSDYFGMCEDFIVTPQMLEPPMLVIVGEDDNQLLEVFKKLVVKGLDYSKVLFTTDLRVINDINRSILQFSIQNIGTIENPSHRARMEIKKFFLNRD
ncbi:MAG: replication-relaxation family protein [Tissierellales bacterium]|nr:replication-relaxation family protein [Tissierellales bacterium]